jgi:hypothetical protein
MAAMRPEDRERVTVEVACRVLGDKLGAVTAGGPTVDAWLHDTIYEERRRVEKRADVFIKWKGMGSLIQVVDILYPSPVQAPHRRATPR